ncbi:MAG: hypothetical protein IIU80_01550 [Clostridia bacterium]|nr:hypothetical protein [Clostridia bacterium]
MDKIIDFFKEEWLTILSIFLSGGISWIISAAYFHKGNRVNLKSAVIIPLITIIEEPVSRKNLVEIKEISKSPLIRFFYRKEKEKFFKLIKEYWLVSSYNENQANATAIVSDVEDRLKAIGINPRCIPRELDDGSYEYVYPEEINYLRADIEDVFKEYCWQTETDECTKQILFLIKSFVKKIYTNDIVDLYKDYDIKSIIKNAEITDKWNWKFDKYTSAKQEFESLRVVKKIKNIIE